MELDLFDARAAHYNFAVSFRVPRTGEVRRTSNSGSPVIENSPSPKVRVNIGPPRSYTRQNGSCSSSTTERVC